MKTILTIALLSIIFQVKVFAVIEQPTNLKAEVTSPTQVKLSWSGSIDDYCYQVRLKEKSESIWSEFLVTAPSTNRRINNLKVGSSYSWEVQCCGKSKKEVSGFIKGENFITFSDCHAPEEITMIRSGLDYLIVNWDDNGSSKYEVKIHEADKNESKIYFTQNNSIRLDNLLPYTEYEISISSFCKEQDLTGSVFSEAETFSTYSFLQNDFQRLEYAEKSSSSNKIGINPKMISSVKLINTYGQVVSDIKPASSNLDGIYFDLNANTPSGIYVVQIPGEVCKRYFLQ
ncbi:hypothetical protein LBMAG27_21950 [Bacteroidota bacterium]|nr:hypothetical protein LBMAG27_21950 [Bacteroidota bacterium]